MIPIGPYISQSAAMRRDDICIYVSPSNRAGLAALIGDRNTRSKVVWRAEIVLATADGHRTNGIMRRTGQSKPWVWRWLERYIAAGVEGLCATRPGHREKPRCRARSSLPAARRARAGCGPMCDKPFAGHPTPAAMFYYSPDRGGEHPETHLAAYSGIMQGDAYAGFNGLYVADCKPDR